MLRRDLLETAMGQPAPPQSIVTTIVLYLQADKDKNALSYKDDHPVHCQYGTLLFSDL